MHFIYYSKKQDCIFLNCINTHKGKAMKVTTKTVQSSSIMFQSLLNVHGIRVKA